LRTRIGKLYLLHQNHLSALANISSNDEANLTMGDRAWPDKSTATIAAFLIKHHDNLSIGWNWFIGENLRDSSTSSAIAICVRE
jgi:hypothetical protein